MKLKLPAVRFTLVLFLAGCSTSTYQAAPDLSSRAAGLKKVGVIVDAHVTYRTPFLHDARDEEKSAALTAEGAKNMEQALVQQLTANGYEAVVLPQDEGARGALAQYDARQGGMNGRARDYDLEKGSSSPLPQAAALAARAGVDGVVIVRAHNHAMSPYATLLSSPLLMVTEVAYMILIAPDRDPRRYNADFAVLDKDGRMLFYDRDDLDVTDPASVSQACSRFAGALTGAARGEPASPAQ